MSRISKEKTDKLRIIRIEEEFVAVSKPPGLPFHAEKGESVLTQLDSIKNSSDPSSINLHIPADERLFPVHRLDIITSGILLFGRGRKHTNELSNEFRFSRVHKVYLALSIGQPPRKEGTIIGDMRRGKNGMWQLLQSRHNPAITYFKCISIPQGRKDLKLFIVTPKTGKTHQIRAALKSMDSPVLGDPLYNRFGEARKEDRAYLHAYGIRFQIAGKKFEIIDPPHLGKEFESGPFKDTLKRFSNPFFLGKAPKKP